MSDEIVLESPPGPVIKRFILEVKTYPNGAMYTSTKPMRDQAAQYRQTAANNVKKEKEQIIETCEEVEEL